MYALVLIATAAFAQSDQAGKNADLVSQVKRLVKELDADTAETREQAEKALVTLGPRILEYLPAISARTPAEVKERLGRVRKILQTQMSENVTKETYVTLSGKMSLEKALKSFEEQTGNRVVGYEDRDTSVDVDFKNLAYWSALDQLLDKAELAIDAFGGQPGALALEAKAENSSPRFGRATYSGLFRFEITRMESVRDLRNPATNGLQLNMEVCWEPRLTPIAVSQDIDQIEVSDDQGKKLEVDNEQELTAGVEAETSAVDLVLPLKLPGRDIKKIGSIKGKLTALLPGQVESFEFEKLEKASDVNQKKAGVTVTLEQVRKINQLIEVRVAVRFDSAGNALESHRGWVYNNVAYMLGPGGERIEPATFESTRADENEVGVAYLFDIAKLLPTHKFVYKTPSSLLRMPVTYELRDLELP